MNEIHFDYGRGVSEWVSANKVILAAVPFKHPADDVLLTKFLAVYLREG